MPVLKHSLKLPASQLDGLRSAMRDIQISIGDYYRETARTADPEELATRVRASVGFVQVLHELLRNQSGANREFRTMFEMPEDPRVGIIQAFEYARHLTQHILHPVRPSPSAIFGGPVVGMRAYAVWADVPSSAHERLNAVTKALRPCYEQHLTGQEVTGSFLDAARFFFEVCPDLVHRNANGEWTAFPLRHQAGVEDRLHPEEPADQNAALSWMAHRRPGGDRRIISGSLQSDQGELTVYGMTFTGRCSFTPFFETVEQINADISNGYPYHSGDIASHTTDCAEKLNLPGSVFCSDADPEEWAGEPLTVAPETRDDPPTFATIEDWRLMWAMESSVNLQTFPTRRERRLNASVPDHVG